MNGLEIRLIISWKTAVSLWFQAVASEVICTPRRNTETLSIVLISS